jgi:hypothetical protein
LDGLYKAIIENSHFLSLKEYLNLSGPVKDRLNKKDNVYYEVERDMKKQIEEYRKFGGENEVFLDQSEIKKKDRDKLFDIKIDKMNEEYTVTHKHNKEDEHYDIGPRSGVKITFKNMEELNIDSLEDWLSYLYKAGPEVVLIDEKPYYRELISWHQVYRSMEEGKNSPELFDPNKVIFQSGLELKHYLHVLCLDDDSYKIGQQDRIIYQNLNQTKQLHVGYSLLLNTLFAMGSDRIDVQTGLIRPSLNATIDYLSKSLSLDNWKRLYDLYRHKYYLNSLSYTLSCYSHSGCPKCLPSKLSSTFPSPLSLLSEDEIPLSTTYNHISSSIHRAQNFGKSRIVVFVDKSKTCISRLLLTYLNQSGKKLLKQTDKAERLEENSGELGAKLAYLRAIFKGDREHVYAVDEFMQDDKMRQFYQKLWFEIANGDWLSEWQHKKYDYRWYPLKHCLDTNVRDMYY